MAQPVQAEPTETRPPRVTVPRLTVEETQRRAGAAFDAARDAVMRTQFRPPPASEVTAFRNMVNARLRQTREGETLDVGAVLQEYCEANPNSAIARYNRLFGGDTSWLLSADGSRVGFQSAAFGQLARNYVNALRQPTIDVLVQLNNPRNRSSSVPTSTRDQAVVAALQQSLSSQLSTGRNQLPASVSHDAGAQLLAFTNLIPPPAQEIGEDEFRRRRPG